MPARGQDDDPRQTASAYARILAELCTPGTDSVVVLARHGLTEAEWEQIEEHWEGQFESGNEDELAVSPALVEFTAALQAREWPAEPPLSFEFFLEAVGHLMAGKDLFQLLAAHHVTFDQYQVAQHHWTQKLLTTPHLLERYRKVVG